MNHIETTLSGVAAITASLIGNKAAVAGTILLADATQQDLPKWAQMMMGPVGGFVGLVLGLVWMANRLNKAETKMDKRDDERDADRKTLIVVVEQNSAMLSRVNDALKK